MNRSPRLSKKPAGFFDKEDSLCFAPRLSAGGGPFDARAAQSVFRRAHVARKTDLIFFCRSGGRTLRGFFDKRRDDVGVVPCRVFRQAEIL